VSLARGDATAAADYARDAVAIARVLQHDIRIGSSLLNVGLASLRLDRVADAAAAYDEALELFERNGYGEGAAYGFLGLAALVAERGEHRDAAILLGAADELLNAAGAVLDPTERPLRDQTLERLGDELGADLLESQLSAGAALPLDEAIAVARRLAALVSGDGE
jgi:non-specific serine/threonine protein kinase